MNCMLVIIDVALKDSIGHFWMRNYNQILFLGMINGLEYTVDSIFGCTN